MFPFIIWSTMKFQCVNFLNLKLNKTLFWLPPIPTVQYLPTVFLNYILGDEKRQKLHRKPKFLFLLQINHWSIVRQIHPFTTCLYKQGRKSSFHILWICKITFSLNRQTVIKINTDVKYENSLLWISHYRYKVHASSSVLLSALGDYDYRELKCLVYTARQ